jgi:small subunit ribosomal protein S4
MARDISPIVKRSRREGYALHNKAHKIMAHKSGIPGQHAGRRANKASLYLTQLREKQKVRRIYGLLERQFARLINESINTSNRESRPGDILLELLERRLDNVVFRAGFSSSRKGSRQLVSHGHFMLNGRRVDIPSIRVNPGDEITIRPKSAKSTYFKNIDEVTKNVSTQTLSWMTSDVKKFSISITGAPKRDEAEPEIKEQLIIEYYSR